jgi:hypothetical protein
LSIPYEKAATVTSSVIQMAERFVFRKKFFSSYDIKKQIINKTGEVWCCAQAELIGSFQAFDYFLT